MRYHKLGSSEIEASVMALGTWVTGGGVIWGEKPDDSESVRVIQTALDQGINFIDTAPAYGFGHSEEVVGKAIAGRRDKVIVATKCGLWWYDERGSDNGVFDGRAWRKSLRPDTIRLEVEDSLRRLNTDYIDLYQTHWPAVEPEKPPVAETMECLVDLQKQGKIRCIGACNLSMEEIQEYCEYAPLVSHQLRYSMLWREPEAEMFPYCEENNIATLTWMSLEQGLLTGKIKMDRVFRPEEFRSYSAWNPWMPPKNRQRVLNLLDGWRDLLDKYGCTQAQLTIAWTLAQRGVTHVLAGARTLAQLNENLKGADLALEPADWVRMRRDIEALGEPEPGE
jgi:methylglyoxal reductase